MFSKHVSRSCLLDTIYFKQDEHYAREKKCLSYFVNRIIFNLFYFIYTEKKITRKVSEGTFQEYILTRFRKSQKANHSDKKYIKV